MDTDVHFRETGSGTALRTTVPDRAGSDLADIPALRIYRLRLEKETKEREFT